MVQPIEGARDANNDIDYPSIKKKGEAIKDIAKEDLEQVAESLRDIDTGEKTLDRIIIKINDHTLKPLIVEVADSIEELNSEVDGPINDIIAHAEEVHDALQRKYNEEARAAQANQSESS